IWRIASTIFWPCETRTSTCRSFATISSGLYRFLAIAVFLDVKDIPQVGPLQWGWINGYPRAGEGPGRSATPWWDGGQSIPEYRPHSGFENSSGPAPKGNSPYLDYVEVFPKGLALRMEPEDLWAIANLTFAELPPTEYDHPVFGWLEIMDLPSEQALREVCGYPKQDDKILVGCTHLLPGEYCHVFIGPIDYGRTGGTRHILRPHQF